MNWKAWVHSLIAAAIGGAASALGAILISPASFPDNETGWVHLGAVAAFGAIVPVLALLKQSPLWGGDKTSKLPVLLLAALLLPIGLTGCGALRTSTSAAAIAPVPGQLNDFDGNTWRALLAAHDFAAAAVGQAAKLTDPEKTALNGFVAAVNAADLLYAGYHSGTATQQQMQAAMDSIQAKQAVYTNAVTGGK